MKGFADLMNVRIEIIPGIFTKAIEGIKLTFTEVGKIEVRKYLER